MGKVICEICGSNDLLKDGDYFRCINCGACYSAEHLKRMLETKEDDGNTPAQPPEELPLAEKQKENGIREEAPNPREEKRKRAVGIILVAALTLGSFVSCVGATLSSSGLVPRKSQAKQSAEEYLAYRISSENIALSDIRFTSVTATKFKTREEDQYGFFSYLEYPVTVVDPNGKETEYENHFEEFRAKFGEQFDPEAHTKWAYTLTGEYDAVHKERGDIRGEFSVVYVHWHEPNVWYCTQAEFGASQEMLRQDVNNQLMAYLLVTYDIQPNPKIEITSIEKGRNGYYTVYGTVAAED